MQLFILSSDFCAVPFRCFVHPRVLYEIESSSWLVSLKRVMMMMMPMMMSRRRRATRLVWFLMFFVFLQAESVRMSDIPKSRSPSPHGGL